MMARSTVVRTRINTRSMRPTGRRVGSLLGGTLMSFRLPRANDPRFWWCDGSGAAECSSVVPSSARQGASPRNDLAATHAERRRRSVCSGERQHLRPLALGKPTPNSVGLMHLEGMRPTSRHRRAFKADCFGLCLAPGPSWSALPFRMEEERARHPATRRVQLPIPQVGIWPGKAPGVSHIDPLGSLQRCKIQRSRNQIRRAQISIPATAPGIWARSATRTNGLAAGAGKTPVVLPDLPRCSRIRADPGAVDDQTLERFSGFDKSLIMFFVDLDRAFPRAVARPESTTVPTTRGGVAHTPECQAVDFTGWRMTADRLLSVVYIHRFALKCPKDPLWGPYRCFVDDQGSVGSAGASAQLPSTSSSGGVT